MKTAQRIYWLLTGNWINIVKKIMRKIKFCKDGGYIGSK